MELNNVKLEVYNVKAIPLDEKNKSTIARASLKIVGIGNVHGIRLMKAADNSHFTSEHSVKIGEKYVKHYFFLNSVKGFIQAEMEKQLVAQEAAGTSEAK